MLIIASKPGQLGNMLFVFANFIAFSIENNISVADPSFDDYADWFQSTRQDFFCRYPSRSTRFKGNKRTRKLLYLFSYYSTRVLARGRVNCRRTKSICLDWEEELSLDDPEFVNSIHHGQVIFFQGWQFRHPLAFTKYADEIRRFFRPLETFEHNIRKTIEEARQHCDILVGVHIRHGDYKTFLNGKYFYETREYAKIMAHTESLFAGKKVAFLVCSNVQQDINIFSGTQTFFGPDHPLEDMYSLAGCDYIVGAPSTYTMWASFYGQVPLYMIKDISKLPNLDEFTCFQG